MMNSLEYCLKQNKVVSVYCDKDHTECHLTGLVNCYNDSELLINHITPYGDYDGYVLIHIGDIYRIDYDSTYEKKIETLYHLKKQSHYDIDFSSEEILFTILDFAKNNNLIVTLNFESTSVSGFINHYDEKLDINVINEYGLNEGISVIDINQVDYFSIDTCDEQSIKLLHSAVGGSSC